MESLGLKAEIPDMNGMPPINTMSNTVTEEGFSADARQMNPNIEGSFAAMEKARNTYSTEEKIIGTWLDGKPIYQKTIDIGPLLNNAVKTYTHGIENCDLCLSVRGVAIQATDRRCLCIPFGGGPAAASTVYAVVPDFTKTEVSVSVGIDRRGFTNTFMTLQYTKTTD